MSNRNPSHVKKPYLCDSRSHVYTLPERIAYRTGAPIPANFSHPSDDDTPCVPWTGAVGSNGHAHMKWEGSLKLVQRLLWELRRGKIPAGQVVRHKCLTKECISLDHLELGTHGDNARDRIRDGTQSRTKGESHGRSKLVDSDVLEIRRLYDDRISNQYELAKMYRVTRSLITLIVNRKMWTHIESNPDWESRKQQAAKRNAQICADYETGKFLQKDLAEKYSLSCQRVSRILKATKG